MGLFTKKYPMLTKLSARQNWAVGEAMGDDRPMFFRINTGAKSFAAHPELPYRFGVAIPLVEPDDRGLPQAAEMAVLNEIEDALAGALEPSADGVLVLAITTSGMREFVFYIRDPQCAASAVAAARACCQGHEVQHYVESDPQWTVYQQFA
jgi:hypothetical protein